MRSDIQMGRQSEGLLEVQRDRHTRTERIQDNETERRTGLNEGGEWGWEEEEQPSVPLSPGAGIKEADDRQVTTVFTVQPSFHHRSSTKRVS